MAQVDGSDRSRLLMGLYTGLALVAGVCGVVIGIASIADARDNMFFIAVIVFSILVPIGCGAGLGVLGLAAGRGSRVSFYASWFLAGGLLIPVGIFVYLLVLGRQPSFLEEFPQMGPAEIIGLASLISCFACLVAMVVVGFQVRGRLPNSR